MDVQSLREYAECDKPRLVVNPRQWVTMELRPPVCNIGQDLRAWRHSCTRELNAPCRCRASTAVAKGTTSSMSILVWDAIWWITWVSVVLQRQRLV